jgi:hypothetical protein
MPWSLHFGDRAESGVDDEIGGGGREFPSVHAIPKFMVYELHTTPDKVVGIDLDRTTYVSITGRNIWVCNNCV